MAMKRWRLVALATAAAVAILVIAGAAWVHAMTDPERLKALAREKARETWSRDLAIGDLSLHILPLPTLHARDVTLGDAPGDEDPWHLHADRIVAGLQLWPLLRGKALLRDVQIEGDVGHRQHRVKVVAALDDVSHFGQPDAASSGKIDLDWGKTRVTASGSIPLQAQLHNAALTAQLESEALGDMLGFFGVVRARTTAPARAKFELKSIEDHLEIRELDATLGKHHVIGSARLSTSGPRPVIDARLQSERIDWAQALLDAGDAPADPLPPDELFHDRPLAWPLLVSAQGAQGTIDVDLALLRLRNGVELQHAKANMAFDGDRLEIRHFTTSLLGGSATGTVRFEGRKRQVRAEVQGKNLLLERWFKERGREIPFTGGPMSVTASIVASGKSMRDLAKSMTGPVTIRMGPGVYTSQKAGDAEAMMVAFSRKDSTGRIAFECAGADLPFKDGLASGNAIVGARSDVSRLLTSGHVSFRDETVDLRGRVRPKPGLGVGLAAIAGDIRISGKIRAMKVTLDPAAKPAVVARAGAAILTLGLSLAGKAVANATREDDRPCEEVFSKAPAS